MKNIFDDGQLHSLLRNTLNFRLGAKSKTLSHSILQEKYKFVNKKYFKV